MLGPRGKEAVNLVRQHRSLLLGRKIPPPFLPSGGKGGRWPVRTTTKSPAPPLEVALHLSFIFQNMKFTSFYIANQLVTCQWLVFCFIPFRLLPSGISWIDEIIVGSLLASAVVPLNKSVV